MLPARLNQIKNMLKTRKIFTSTGEEGLLHELEEVESLLAQAQRPDAPREAQRICEWMEKTSRATTGGPSEYCPCCGRKN
jgi:hypothetical protein